MDSSRSKTIVRAGLIFIITNFLLALFSLVIGLLSGSIAIKSDAVHSLIDSVSGLIVIVGEKLAKSKKFATRRAKIERISTIIIAIIIIASGVHIVLESIEKLSEPVEEIEYPLATIIVVLGAIVTKLALAIHLKRRGRSSHSDVLSASGAETMNDMMISVAVLLSIIAGLIWPVNIEPYISLLVAIIIFKIGLEFIFPRLSSHHHHPLETDHLHGVKPTQDDQD